MSTYAIPRRHTLQFFFKFNETEREEYECFLSGERTDYHSFENAIKQRIFNTFTAHSDFTGKNMDIVVRLLNYVKENEDSDALVIIRFEEIRDVDHTMTDNPEEMGIIGQIHNSTKRNAKFYLNEEKSEWWHMWPYLPEYTEEDEMIWPPAEDLCLPFITYKDYETFAENDDDLQKCISAFKTDMPRFLRQRWRESYEDEIQKIEKAGDIIQAFSKSIEYPGNGGDAILEDLFTCVEQEALDRLSDDTYTILGYFYHLHLAQ